MLCQAPIQPAAATAAAPPQGTSVTPVAPQPHKEFRAADLNAMFEAHATVDEYVTGSEIEISDGHYLQSSFPRAAHAKAGPGLLHAKPKTSATKHIPVRAIGMQKATTGYNGRRMIEVPIHTPTPMEFTGGIGPVEHADIPGNANSGFTGRINTDDEV